MIKEIHFTPFVQKKQAMLIKTCPDKSPLNPSPSSLPLLSRITKTSAPAFAYISLYRVPKMH